MHTGRLLPSLLAAEPLKPHFQVEPGNEISQEFWLKLTRMSMLCAYLVVFRAWNSELRPLNTELRPLNTELRPLNTELQPQNMKLQPQNMKLQPQNSKLHSQKLKLHPQNSKRQLFNLRNLFYCFVDEAICCFTQARKARVVAISPFFLT
jgi:hypothetical protein